MTLTALQREFAERVIQVATRLGLVTEPTLDETEFRLVQGDLAIDLFNPWHLSRCRPDPDEDELAELLTPRELGEAGYLGRVDVVRRMLAAGADPNAPEPDGVLPIRRTVSAWVTTDLHISVVRAMLDAGLVVPSSQRSSLFLEVVGTEIDGAIGRMLFPHDP